MFASPFYLFFVLLAESLADQNCPSITLKEGSPEYPEATDGGELDLYALFYTEGDAKELNVTWYRTPSPLSDSSERHWINITDPSNHCLLTNLTLINLANFPDFGDYTVEVCSNCTCFNFTFTLYLFPCDVDDVPQPVVNHHQTVIAETSLTSPLTIYMIFKGIDGLLYYPTHWNKSNQIVCTEDGPALEGYSCDRQNYGNCSFTPILTIDNPSFKSADKYLVQATGNGLASNVAMFNLVVVREPDITCNQHNPTSNKNFECTITNYSIYIDLLVVKDEENVTKRIPASEVCTPIPQENHIAKCSIKLDKGKYSVCVNYSSSVTTSTPLYDHCADNINVHNTSFWNKNKYYFIGAGSFLLVAVIMVAVMIAVPLGVHRRRRRCRQRTYHQIRQDSQQSEGQEEQSENSQQSEGQVEQRRSVAEHHAIDQPVPLTRPETQTSESSPLSHTLSSTEDIESTENGPTEESSVPSSNPHTESMVIGPIISNPSTQDGNDITQDAPIRTNSARFQTIGVPSSGPNGSAIETRASRQTTVCILYAQNPREYKQIEQLEGLDDKEKQDFDEEKIEIEKENEDKVARHRAEVREFAEFLQSEGIDVRYDQLIADKHVNFFVWLQQSCEEAHYVVLLITESFMKFLRDKPVPPKERIFQTEYLSNLCSGVFQMRIVCVFLNRTLQLKQVPPALRSGNLYELWTSYNLQDGRSDDLRNFMSLIKNN